MHSHWHMANWSSKHCFQLPSQLFSHVTHWATPTLFFSLSQFYTYSMVTCLTGLSRHLSHLPPPPSPPPMVSFKSSWSELVITRQTCSQTIHSRIHLSSIIPNPPSHEHHNCSSLASLPKAMQSLPTVTGSHPPSPPSISQPLSEQTMALCPSSPSRQPPLCFWGPSVIDSF